MASPDEAAPEFPPMVNDLILRAARGEATERVPVWVMRQAGRYLPEFRAEREKADFFTMCRTPALACEVTLQPLRRFDLDAAIIFSDILVIPQAVGMTVEMRPGVGPFFPEPLVEPSDVEKLTPEVDVYAELGYVFQAITRTRKELKGKATMIGFCGGPWTVMAYMVEGSGTKQFAKSKRWLYLYPEASHKVLDMLATVSIDYLVGQVKAGAQMLQVFESWSGELPPELFKAYCLDYVTRIANGVRAKLKADGSEPPPMVVFAKGAHYALEDLSAVYDVVQLDWTVDPSVARTRVGPNTTLQGNLDPGALYGTKETIEARVKTMVAAFGTQRYIANLGHGMQPGHDPENLKVFVDAVHSVSEAMNKAG